MALIAVPVVQPPAPAAEPNHRGRWATVMSIATTVMTIVVVMVACSVMVTAIVSRFSSNDQYTLFGHPALTVLSGSMTPAIDTGDFILDSAAPGATNLKKGQIITFYDSPGSKTVLTHRIVQVIPRAGGVFYRTKGDANKTPDAALRPARDVIGVYQIKVPRGGYFLTNLHRPIVFGLLIASPGLWFLAGVLRSWAKAEDTPDQEPLKAEADTR